MTRRGADGAGSAAGVRTLIVMAKAPRAGRAKTRLASCGTLTPALAAELAEAFLRDTLRHAAELSGVRTLLCTTPPEEERWFAELAPWAAQLPQAQGDLGARLRSAFRAAFDAGAPTVIAIGSDTPQLTAPALAAAFGQLERAACVLGPASDGGYHLLGLRAPADGLFEGLDWSTPRVLAQTRERASRLGLETALTPELRDIDDLDALEQLEARIGADGEPCPHTARVLARWRAAQVFDRLCD